MTLGKTVSIATGRKVLELPFIVMKMPQVYLSMKDFASSRSTAGISTMASTVHVRRCRTSMFSMTIPFSDTACLIAIFSRASFTGLMCAFQLNGRKDLLTKLGLEPVSNRLATVPCVPSVNRT